MSKSQLTKLVEKQTRRKGESRVVTLEELVAQITPANRHPEVDWGPPVGREKEMFDVARVRRIPRRP